MRPSPLTSSFFSYPLGCVFRRTSSISKTLDVSSPCFRLIATGGLSFIILWLSFCPIRNPNELTWNMSAACISSSSRIVHPNLALFPEMLIVAKGWRRTSDVTRTPSTIPSWTRIICSSYKLYRKHSLADSMGIPPTQPICPSGRWHPQGSFTPISRLTLAPFPPIFGTSEAKNLGPATHSLISVLTKSLTTDHLEFSEFNRLAWNMPTTHQEVSPRRQVNKGWMDILCKYWTSAVLCGVYLLVTHGGFTSPDTSTCTAIHLGSFWRGPYAFFT